MHIRTEIAQHESFAKITRSEMRHDELELRVKQSDGMQVERIREPHVEVARKPEFLPHANGQDATVYEHREVALRSGEIQNRT